jgi:hypothetical protein
LRRAQMEEDEKGRVSADDSTSLTDKDDTDWDKMMMKRKQSEHDPASCITVNIWNEK